MINTCYFKLLVLTLGDTAEKIKTDKDPNNYEKRDEHYFFQNYSAIVLQGGLTMKEFLSDEYKELREAAYSVSKDKIILESVQNELTPAKEQ